MKVIEENRRVENFNCKSRKEIRNILLILSFGFISTVLGQNNIIFKDKIAISLQVLNNQLIDILGESNYPYQLSRSTTEEYELCFFRKIASNSSYKMYQEDLIKAKNHSENKDERTFFLYKIKYINSALWSCIDENPEFLKEMSRADKIIPQSEEKIKAFAEVHLEDYKKEIGAVEFIELGKKINWEGYSQCYMSKLWMTFTTKEMFNMSPENEKIAQELMEICINENLKIFGLEKKYDSNYVSDDSALTEYISFINHPKSKGLDFKIKSPKGFVNTFANSPNIIGLWRKENAQENDDPWIFILILEEKNYDNKIEFEKALIEDGSFSEGVAAQLNNPSNLSYFSTEGYPGLFLDYESANGKKFAMVNLWLPNHLLQFHFAERKSNNYDYYRDILIAFSKSIKFL